MLLFGYMTVTFKVLVNYNDLTHVGDLEKFPLYLNENSCGSAMLVFEYMKKVLHAAKTKLFECTTC